MTGCLNFATTVWHNAFLQYAYLMCLKKNLWGFRSYPPVRLTSTTPMYLHTYSLSIFLQVYDQLNYMEKNNYYYNIISNIIIIIFFTFYVVNKMVFCPQTQGAHEIMKKNLNF